MERTEKNIYNKIKELSDIDLQRKMWLNENNNTGLISSYVELMNTLFDDYNFDYFIDEIAPKLGLGKDIVLELNRLRTLLNDYREKPSDYEILQDSQWRRIVEQAKVVLNTW